MSIVNLFRTKMADDSDGCPLHKAVFDNDLQTVSRLLRKHDVAAKDKHGNSNSFIYTAQL